MSESRETGTLGFNGPRVIYAGPNRPPTSSRTAPPAFSQQEVARLLPRAELEFVRLTLGMFATSFAGAPVVFSDSPRPFTVVATIGRTRLDLELDPVTYLPARFGTLAYLDYREVDGVKVPFRRLSLGSGEWTRDTWTIDRIQFNVDIPEKKVRTN